MQFLKAVVICFSRCINYENSLDINKNNEAYRTNSRVKISVSLAYKRKDYSN